LVSMLDFRPQSCLLDKRNLHSQSCELQKGLE
jgi:hypothetical protein